MPNTLSIKKLPYQLENTIHLPSSKSLSNRALILQAISQNGFSIENISDADDTQLMQELLNSREEILDCRNAGTTLRFLTAYFAISDQRKILTGKERMKARPIRPLVEALRDLGASIQYLEQEGYPPILIEGQILTGGAIEMDASVSSQFITALLLIAPFTKEGIHLVFSGIPVSRPYFNMTIKMLEYFNVKVRQKSNEVAVLPKQKLTNKPLSIEPDWTSASYWLGLAAIFPGSRLTFPGLSQNSWQGDRALTSFLSRFGLNFAFKKQDGLVIDSTGEYPIEFEALLTDHPDLVPTLAALCTTLQIPFNFQGLDHLRYKETDRLDALARELQKVGVKVQATETGLRCDQFHPVSDQAIALETYDDHRLAMSWSLPAAKYPNISIEEPEVVKKSYPQFWEQLENLGFKLMVRNA